MSELHELATARHRVSDLLAGSGLSGDRRYGVLVAMTELLTNALLHARTPVHLRVAVTPERVEVGVTDDDPRPPSLQPPDPRRVGGHGLRLVDAMATEWGSHPTPQGGKEVWFRFDT